MVRSAKQKIPQGAGAGGASSHTRQAWEAFVAQQLAPLLQLDGGSAELLSHSAEACVIRLTGRFRGCPGTPLVIDEILLPLCKRHMGEDCNVRFQSY